jgi:hypothetical protein
MGYHENLPVFIRWTELLSYVMDTTEKFPKRVRFTISTRIDNMALGVLELIIETAYTKKRTHLIQKTNLELEKMRVLFRICYQKRYLSGKKFKHIIHELYEIGKMLGGWARSQQ